jgi:hypothetical protein
MTWTEKQAILSRLGHSNFASEDHFDEWYSELDRVQKQPIKRALCEAEEYAMPTFSWARNYFTTNKNCKNGTAKSHA